MTNRNGVKGSSFERLMADTCNEHISEFIDRRVKTGAKDKGDLSNLRSFWDDRIVAECKNVAKMNLSGWIQEAEEERINDGATIGVVFHKRRGKGQGLDQYCTMTVRDFVYLVTGNRP